MNRHPVKRLTAPDRTRADIDVLMVPLIKALWYAGYETVTCCQDIGEVAGQSSSRSLHWSGYALLEMPIRDMCELLDVVKETPQFKDRMHWADDGAWEIRIQVMPFGIDGPAEPAPWAALYFPNDQIADLTRVVREDGWRD